MLYLASKFCIIDGDPLFRKKLGNDPECLEECVRDLFSNGVFMGFKKEERMVILLSVVFQNSKFIIVFERKSNFVFEAMEHQKKW
jgi:hypothetical protein